VVHTSNALIATVLGDHLGTTTAALATCETAVPLNFDSNGQTRVGDAVCASDAVEEEMLDHSPPPCTSRQPRTTSEPQAIGLDRNEVGSLPAAPEAL
jgi:hypothetical protein